ncbi:homoserine O-acetyltransferase [Luteimonas cucumeris]|uniref:Homoserine O-acetyltransferase n=1 Tax=Luteimonas cucumeris TaxID=985012 RepID=A0A562LFF3_9GAMM|nr:homoserine O-succinyltransferase [Luteimonas cucumeris]TWI06340.1 homoserine O-acetyltransferase [Luteimonas cucumeris]
MSLVESAAQFATHPFVSPYTFEPVQACDAVRGSVELDLSLRHAGRRKLHIGYEVVGPADAPAVLVAGGISADRHVVSSAAFPQPGWWQAQAQTFDTTSLRVIAIDWIGADGALDAPIDSADQADAIAGVLDALGVRTLAAFVGCSYGAMVGLQFAANHGDRVRQLVAISGAHRAHPYASAWRALQRKIVALGQLQCAEDQGLSLARQLAILSYRTPQEFAERFAAAAVIDGPRARCASEDYLDACGSRFVERFDATAYTRLSESIDLHAVDATRIGVPTVVVAIEEDLLVPVADAYALVEQVRADTQVRVLRSKYGHDAFLKEADAIASILRPTLIDCCGEVA